MLRLTAFLIAAATAIFSLILFAQTEPAAACPAELSARIPPRPADAIEGTQFVDRLAELPVAQREAAIVDEVLKGNIPTFLRQLVPVELTGNTGKPGTPHKGTICVMPDFLAIGSNADFVRMPMDLHSATKVARELGFVLPTRKIVEAIHKQAVYRFRPEPMTPGPKMSSPEYYETHNVRIRAQRHQDSVPLGALVAGHKKTVVMTNRLNERPGRIAIFGWFRRDGNAIQPLSTVHGAEYADYSHGIRLISETVLIEGEPRSIYDVMEDRGVAGIVSREGGIRNFRALMQDSDR